MCRCYKFLRSTVSSFAQVVTSSLGIEVAGGKQSFGFTESEPAKSLSESNKILTSQKFARKMRENVSEENEFAVNLAR